MTALWCLVLLAAPPATPAGAVEAASPAASTSPAGDDTPAGPTPEDDQRAKALYLAGSEAYQRGRYDSAIAMFEEARRLSERPVILFSLGQAYRLQYFVDGDPDKLQRAVAMYRGYVDAVPDGGRRDHATRHLSTLIPLLGRSDDARGAGPARLVVSSPTEGASARVGTKVATDMPATFEVPPGPHTVIIEAPGFIAAEKEAVAVAGQYMPIDVTLLPRPGRLAVRAEAGTIVKVGGRMMGVAPLDGPIELPPGRHQVELAAAGHISHVQAVEVARDGEALVEAELEWTGQRLVAVSLFGMGAALLATSGVFMALAFDAQDDAQAILAQRATSSITREEYDRYWSRYDDRDAHTIRAGVLASSAVTVIIVGELLWAFDRPTGTAPVMPMLGTSADGLPSLGLSGRW